VIFNPERLQELTAEGRIGELSPNFFSFIGYQMDPDQFERTLAQDIAGAVVAVRQKQPCCAPLDLYDISPSRWSSALLNAEVFPEFL
jgi:hypothetical protein